MPFAPGGGGTDAQTVFYEEGSAVGTGTLLNFVGAGVTATFSNGTAIATISGGTADGSIIVQDEGSTIGTATVVNFTGGGGTASFSNGTATVDITGVAGAPSDAQYIVGTSNATLSAEKVRTDIYTNYHPDSYPASKNGASNEFDGSGTAAYVWTDTPGTTNENSEYPGHLYILASLNVGTESYSNPFVPGAADFTVVAKIEMGGAIISDNAAWQVGVASLSSSTAVIWQAMVLNDSASDALLGHRYFDTVQTTISTGVAFGAPVWVMVQRTSANVYTGFFSPNGRVWAQGGSSTVATTVERVGIAVNCVSTNTYNRAVIDYIRVFDSLTRKIGA